MKRVLAVTVLAVMVAMAAAAQEGAPKKARHIDVLQWLVGGVWTADASKMGGGMQRIETRYTWADNNAYVRFNTHFVMDRGTMKNYDGQFFWNPEQATLSMWYMDAGNSIIQGPVQVDGQVTQLSFRAQDFEGKMADLRVNLTRKTNDDYIWTLEEKAGDAWKPLASLEYLRTLEK